MPPALLSSPDYSPFLPPPAPHRFFASFPPFHARDLHHATFHGNASLNACIRTYFYTYVRTYVRTCKYSTYKVAMRHELTHTVELRPDQLGPRVFTSLSWRNDNATRHLRRIHQARVQGGRGYGFLFFFFLFFLCESATLSLTRSYFSLFTVLLSLTGDERLFPSFRDRHAASARTTLRKIR